jgi:hypothetical protein
MLPLPTTFSNLETAADVSPERTSTLPKRQKAKQILSYGCKSTKPYVSSPRNNPPPKQQQTKLTLRRQTTKSFKPQKSKRIAETTHTKPYRESKRYSLMGRRGIICAAKIF